MTLLPRRRTRPHRAVLGLTALVLAAAACAPGEDSDPAEETEASDVETDVAGMGDITLTVWDQQVRGGQDQSIKKLNAAFEAEYPNVTIKRVSRSFEDLRRTLRLAITGDDAPDVVQANNARADMGAFVQAGLLRPLDGYTEVYGWADRYPESVRALASYSEDGATFGEGNLYGMAQTGELVGLWYSKSKLEELGIEPPSTLEELEAALATAKDAGEVPIQFGNLEQWPGIHNFGFVQNQVVPREEIRQLGFGQPGASWTTPENEQAAQTFAEWAETGYFTEGFAGADYDPVWQDFADGNGVFLIAGTWLLADLSAAMGDDLGFMLPPANADGDLAVTGGTGLPFAITENSENPDAAAAYIDFITSPEAMTTLAEAGELPVVDTAEQEVSGPAQEVFDAWATANESDALVPYLDYATPDFPELLGGEIQQLGAGEVSPGDFVKSLEEEYASFTDGQ